MKIVLGKGRPWSLELAQAAVENGADALWIPSGMQSEVKKMGIIQRSLKMENVVLGKDVVVKEIRKKQDEEEIFNLTLSKRVVVRGVDWTIVPLENLLSKTRNIFLEVQNPEEGRTHGNS